MTKLSQCSVLASSPTTRKRIVPISAGKAYTGALRNATMTTVAACGHFAEMEKPAEVAKLVTDFISA